MTKLAWKRLRIFIIIGGLGFGVEALIITLANSKLGFSPVETRLFSFPCAVVLTWWLNRQYNFHSRESSLTELVRYAGTQGLGALTNLAVFAGCLALLPSLALWPVLALGFGAIAGLAINFILSDRYVFMRRAREQLESESRVVYTGRDNLLAMQHARNYNNFLSRLICRFGKGAHTVVDFGAGLGALAEGVRPWAERLICVEPDSVQIGILKAAGYETSENILFAPPESVDYVYTVNVLEHIHDDRETLKNIFTVLKPGGRLLIYVPAMQWLYSSMDTSVGHVRRYHMKDLTEKVSGAGFVVKKREYVDSLGVPATLVYKLVGGSRGHINTNALATYDWLAFPISRILDKLFSQIGGKNLLVVCEKP